MPVRSLKVPTEVRKVIRRLHPELKRKLRAALSDILDDPTCGKHSKRSLKDIGVCDWEEVESSIGSASAPSKREKGTGYFFSLPVKIKPGKSPLCREFLEDNKAATPITLLTAGNGRTTVFHKPQDYEAFLSLLSEAKTRHGVKIFGFCLMPNHFHVVLEPAHQTALSQFMQWLLTSHVRRYHQHYGGSGHVWQGRFKSFPVQRDEHLITVLRYVLQNPVRAGLSSTARDWLWSSLRRPQVVDPWPVGDERQWLEQLDEPIRAEQLVNVRECLNRQRPYGRTEWQVKMASMFGLGSTLRPRGRPRNEKKSSLSPF